MSAAPSRSLELRGHVRLSAPEAPRQGGGDFSGFVEANGPLLERYFQARLHPEPLHVAVSKPHDLQRMLDEARFPPDIVIPLAELEQPPARTGDCLAWPCRLYTAKIADAPPCWIFRRQGSRLPGGLIEIVSPVALGQCYGLEDADPVRVSFQY